MASSPRIYQSPPPRRQRDHFIRLDPGKPLRRLRLRIRPFGHAVGRPHFGGHAAPFQFIRYLQSILCVPLRPGGEMIERRRTTELQQSFAMLRDRNDRPASAGNTGRDAAYCHRLQLRPCQLPQKYLLGQNFGAFNRLPKTLARSIGHYKEWITACKGGKPANCNFEFAGRMTGGSATGNPRRPRRAAARMGPRRHGHHQRRRSERVDQSSLSQGLDSVVAARREPPAQSLQNPCGDLLRLSVSGHSALC